jgi:uncharacterized protein YyaL (SSP411 family)
MHTNRLIKEKSPYLQQHAHNPVDWYAWGPEAFEKARAEDKPIFLSIGYSTCHWCHVMERESFESEEIATVLNRSFVPVKVDREERPDVDRIYMHFVQATTGSGGWPMSVWLTPGLKPFYGGTYFPPDNRYGRPGFRYLLEQLAAAWQHDRNKVMESSDDVLSQLQEQARVSAGVGTIIEPGVLDSAFYQFRRNYDSRLGGFGSAPKFPRPAVFNFLLRYAWRTGNVAEHEAAEMVVQTLRAMARGGMNDQLGGGFHRYSVDERWFVPHFEKMLYDQAQLAISYIEAWQITGEPALAQVARDIFDYVLRDMTDKEGGFYSAEDADSVIDPANPHEKGEGAFYIWSAEELVRLLGADTYRWFAYRYGVEPDGNVASDPHQEFTGRNILYEQHTIAETAHQFGLGEDQIRTALDEARMKLLSARGQRVRPHLDDKILTAWNGLMISAFAAGGFALNESRYLAAAQRAAEFISSKLWDGRTLLRRYREGEAAIPGFLDDYAFFAQGLLDLYEAVGDEGHLRLADQLAARMLELFEDKQEGAFFSTTEHDPSLVLRMKEDYDGAEPSGNSIAVLLLLRLARILSRDGYRESAERALRAFAGRMRQIPSGVPQMLVALMYHLSPPRQIVIAGSPAGSLLDLLRPRFLPMHEILRAMPLSMVEHVRDMHEIDGRPAAYVCENFACQLPTSEPEQLARLLQ